MNRPGLDRVRKFLRYDADTGVFTWAFKRRGRFCRDGSIAGSPASNGYIRITVDGISSGAHQLAWFYVTGEWPVDEIDHRNGNRADNRFSNLRQATTTQNRCNSRQRRATLKGARKFRSRWVAKITVKRKSIHLGCYATEQEAHEAYWAAAQRYHGEYARKA